MEELTKRICRGLGIIPPAACEKSLQLNFRNCMNIEWHTMGEDFEAIFYKDNLEHMATFTPDGSLMDYKIYLPAEYLPEVIKGFLETRGEIMNALLKNRGNCIEYEIILRDTEKKRHLLLLNEFGKITEEKFLL